MFLGIAINPVLTALFSEYRFSWRQSKTMTIN
jgi:hypothetical protein